MARVVRGTVKGDIVVLEKGATLPDGATVTVRLSSKDSWLKHAGVWTDWEQLDTVVREIYRARTTKVEGPPMRGASSTPITPSPSSAIIPRSDPESTVSRMTPSSTPA